MGWLAKQERTECGGDYSHWVIEAQTLRRGLGPMRVMSRADVDVGPFFFGWSTFHIVNLNSLQPSWKGRGTG